MIQISDNQLMLQMNSWMALQMLQNREGMSRSTSSLPEKSLSYPSMLDFNTRPESHTSVIYSMPSIHVVSSCEYVIIGLMLTVLIPLVLFLYVVGSGDNGDCDF